MVPREIYYKLIDLSRDALKLADAVKPYIEPLDDLPPEMQDIADAINAMPHDERAKILKSIAELKSIAGK